MPTLILSGADDDLLDPADSSKLAASIQGSLHHVYDETGHLVFWERPDWVAQDLVDFVTQRSEGERARLAAESG